MLIEVHALTDDQSGNSDSHQWVVQNALLQMHQKHAVVPRSSIVSASFVCRVLLLLFDSRDFKAKRLDVYFAFEKSWENGFDSVNCEMKAQPGVCGVASAHIPHSIEIWKILDFIISGNTTSDDKTQEDRKHMGPGRGCKHLLTRGDTNNDQRQRNDFEDSIEERTEAVLEHCISLNKVGTRQLLVR